MTDRDEIDARMQELIPFLQDHKDVNRSNYKWCIQDSTSYQFLQYLLSIKTYFQIEVLASDDIEQIGNFIKKLYKETNYHSDTNISPTETVNKLYKRYCESLIYAQHQFNKILFYMFEKMENGLNEHYYVVPKRIKKQTYSVPAKEDSITFKKIMEGFEIMNELYYSQFK